MKKLRAAIVDDEDMALDLLAHYIGQSDRLVLAGRFEAAGTALAFLAAEQPEVVFLDIQMPQHSGLDMVRALAYRPAVVLVTAYSQYAAHAYDLDVVDYLLKPYSAARFEQAAAKAWAYCQGGAPAPVPATMAVKQDGVGRALPIADILYVEGLKQYTRIHTMHGPYIHLARMRQMEALLAPHNFARIHKSYIVNVGAIARYKGGKVYIGTVALPVGRHYKAQCQHLWR